MLLEGSLVNLFDAKILPRPHLTCKDDVRCFSRRVIIRAETLKRKGNNKVGDVLENKLGGRWRRGTRELRGSMNPKPP